MPSEYNGWIKEQQIERPNHQWTKIDSIYEYNRIKNNINYQNGNFENTLIYNSVNEVDINNEFKRTPKKSAYWFKELILNNGF